MTSIAAIWRGGVFEPEQLVRLPEGARVEVREDPSAPMQPSRYQELAGRIPEEEHCVMESAIEEAFGSVDADDWK